MYPNIIVKTSESISKPRYQNSNIAYINNEYKHEYKC